MTKTIVEESAIAVEKREREQFVKMTQTKISRLIIGLGIPTTLSMMVTSLYNLADSYFVSLLGNDAVTAAASNLLALMSIIQAVGFTFGMGSGALVSRRLGERDREGANQIFSSALFVSCACGLFILLMGFFFLTLLMRFFGAKSIEVLGYWKEYARYLLFAAPFMCMSFVLNNVLRAEGKAVLSMIGLIAGAVVNVILDPILIFGFDMGISGAAIATCFSQMLGFAILLFMFLSGKTITRFSFRSIARKASIYGEVLATGFPSFCRQILASVCTLFLNSVSYDCGMAYYGTVDGGEAAQAALGIVNKVFMLAFSMALGIGQGYQPVLGYNYSAKRFDRVKAAYLFTLTFSTIVMTAFASVCAIISPYIMKAFSLSAAATEIGALSLRLQCIAMPLLPLNFMAGITYQSVGNKALAAVLSISRQGLFYIPAVLILPELFGLRGVQSCQTIADFCAFFFSIPCTGLFFKDLKKKSVLVEMENQEKVLINE